MMQYTFILVFITVPSREVGHEIATLLVEENLAACVNIVTGITSIYRWQDAIERDDELLLIAKTKSSYFERLATTVKRVHPYEVPEVIALPVVAGSNEYLAWIDTETSA
jgi:periplasmic divalent cation tolerance protein